jgi:tRNA(adenine34) deaminase
MSVDGGHEYWMSEALALAAEALLADEVPVGAVVVMNGQIIGRGFNSVIRDHDPTAHAEIQALRHAASTVGNYRLPGASLYVTLEPCAMCAGALVNARIKTVVFGAKDPRAGAAGSIFQVLKNPLLNHQCDILGGIGAEQSAQMLREFFRARRK